MRRQPSDPAEPGRGQGWAHRYLPPQHGAWAMLVVPFAIGVAAGRPVGWHIPLLVAWLGGYLLSYYALLAVKTHRLNRVAPQVRLYATVTVIAGLPVAVARPGILAFVPAFVVLLAINVVAARGRDDRSLLAGFASVLQSCLIAPMAVEVAGGNPVDVVPAALVLLAYFAGSVVYVKTVIRERGNRGYRRASIAFHAAATIAVTVVSWPLGVVFGWLLVRATWLPTRGLNPRQIGLIELANSVGLLVLVPLTVG